MERFRIVTHRGKSILRIDLTHFTIQKKEELKQAIEQVKAEIATHSPGSLLTLTDVTGLRFNMDVLKILIDFTKHNKPYVKAGAIFGIAGLLQSALFYVSRMASRNFLTFGTELEALDWLVTQ